MAKLWDYYDGEPFMENPHLAIVGNPYKVGSIIERKKVGFRKISQKGKTMARRKAVRRGVKNSPRRRRRTARRNHPLSTAGLVFNPRRRRARRMRANPRRRRSSYRKNPAVLGVALPPINMIAWGAGGFVAPPMVEGFINQFLPVEFASSVLGRYAVKIGSVLGLTYLTKTILSNKEAFPVALGGSLYVVVSAINEFLPQLTAQPAPTTQAYRSGMIKAYRSGMITTGVNAGLNQYSKTNLAQARPGLAAARWDLGPSGMLNPTQADPRFSNVIPR